MPQITKEGKASHGALISLPPRPIPILFGRKPIQGFDYGSFHGFGFSYACPGQATHAAQFVTTATHGFRNRNPERIHGDSEILHGIPLCLGQIKRSFVFSAENRTVKSQGVLIIFIKPQSIGVSDVLVFVILPYPFNLIVGRIGKTEVGITGFNDFMKRFWAETFVFSETP